MESYKINQILEEMAMESKSYFSPIYICKRLNTENIKEVTHLLFSDSYKDIVSLNFEIQCPEGDTDFIVHDLTSVQLNSIKICHHCGIEYLPDLKKIWVTFNFTKKYINYVKKKRNSILSSTKGIREKILIQA